MKPALKWATVIGLPMLALLFVPLARTAHALSVHTYHPMVMGATVGANVVTLFDWAKRKDPDGKIARVAELLSQRNEILEDMHWREGNLETGDRITQRTGLPTVYYRLLNQGVAKSKSTTAQVDEQCGILEARSEVDVDIANLNGDVGAFRISESGAFLEAMSQQFASTVFYGNTGLNPEQFLGLSVRFSSSSATNGQNIIKAGGDGADDMSIWLIGWGDQSVYGIFPKGSKAGLVHEDLGVQDAFDGSNNRFRAYMDRYQWKGGIAVRDWRYIVRIANLDQDVLVADTDGSTESLRNLMAKAIDRLPSLNNCRPVFYCNRTVASMIRIQALNKSVANLGVEKAINQFGKEIFTLTFLGIPIRIVDQLVETETAIS